MVWGSVCAVDVGEPNIQHLTVELDDATSGRAIAYPALCGTCVPGDRVLLNTTAVDLALGTGGAHYVVVRLASVQGVALDAPSGGHVMKLRYTPLQLDVLSVEEPESPHHAVMAAAEDLDGTPVACCGLHSQAPLVAAAVKHARPDLRVAYVMTDFAALPVALSDITRQARAAGLFDAVVSAGQAFGGDLEAVNLHSALLAARHVALADVIVVAIGPGVVGTATPLGHGGVAQGEAINAASAIGGRPVAVLRLSFADTRARHQGVSHHTLTALSRIALAQAVIAMPRLSAEQAQMVDAALQRTGVWGLHARMDSSPDDPFSVPTRGLEVRTMGRTLEQDPAFFAAAFAAGEVCARLASTGRSVG